MAKTSETLSRSDTTEPSPGVVACSGLVRRYGTVRALDGVDVEVREGEFLAVLGPSGCGKTTLLRLIAGFERPDAGVVAIGGQTVARAPDATEPGIFAPPERRRVGIVVQDHALFPHLTVAGNVAYGLSGNRRDQARQDRVAEVLSLVGLEGLGRRYPSDLSGGQQQRVAIARALAPRPQVVLLDEPFANLDATLRARIRGEVRRILKAAGATVVLVTHDQQEALSLADRVAVMSSGRVVQIGEPEDVYQRPADAFVASFVGEAALVAATSDGHILQSPLGPLVASGPAPPAGPVVAAVRPEAVYLFADEEGDGRVVASTYFGHDQLVEVALDAGPIMRARTTTGQRFLPGDVVRLEVAGEVVAYPGAGPAEVGAPPGQGVI